ncbi:alpha/beta fold hydrolase [Corynebacterium cystitidis]|uniref:alpha/beta fold hydrolase n=1 Tax=Corynebacterium cystitidis TaxID=35757 RepID=UPI00211E5D10|nr:hypothetical protein [Corynebacterium cystitidis]
MNSSRDSFSRAARSLSRRAVQRGRKLAYDYLRPVENREPAITSIIRLRSTDHLPRPHRTVRSVNDFLSGGKITQGTYAIWDNGLPIDMLLLTKQSDTLTVVLNGAGEPGVRLPWFSGANVLKGVATHRLSISDPSLYLHPDLNLAWYAGNYRQPNLQEDLARIIEHVARQLKVRRILLMGGSGGGFASLVLGRLLPQSTVVAMNPQTDIERYHEQHVKKYVDICWKGDHDAFRAATASTIWSLEAPAPDRKPAGKIFYLQNTNDDFHVKNHLEPFEKNFDDMRGIYVWRHAWGAGHTPPPKDVITAVVTKAIDRDVEGLEYLGFTPI